MKQVFISAAVIMMIAPPISASENATVFGPNPDLAAGAFVLQLKDYETGVERTRIGLKTEKSRKDRATGLNNLCAGLVGLRQYAEAIEACDASAEINGANWRVYNNRSLAYLGLGRVELARIDLNRGLELNPGARKLLEVADMINERSAPLLADAN